MARNANRVLICDTDPLATSVWHERYMGTRSEAVEKIAKSRVYDLYLLTDCDIPFVQDGTRDGEDIRVWMTGRLEERIQERGIRYLKVSGSRRDRMRLAVAAVDSILRS